MILGTLIVLASCGDPDPNADAEGFVALDINPKIELTVDDDGYVISAYGANEDAQVLLYGEGGIVGVKLEDAVEKITDLSVELGYINADNRVVSASVYAESDKTKSKLEGKIEASVDKSARKAGLTLTVNSEDLHSLIRELEAYKAQNPNSSDIQKLTASKYRLALSASEGGDITLEAAIKLDNEALIERINAAHKRAEQFATAAFKKARDEASRAYQMALEIAKDGVYLEYYTGKLLEGIASLNPNTITNFANATFFVAYDSAAKGLRALEIAADYLDEDGYELTEAEVAAVLEIFGLTEADKAKLEGGDGRITLGSVEAYADRVIKNTAKAQREALEDKIDDLLDEAEDRIEVLVDAAIADYKPEVDSIIAAVKNAKDSLPQITVTVSSPTIDALKAEVTELIAAYDALIADGNLSEDDIEELVELFEDKADERRDALKALITPEEQAEIDAKIANIETKLTAEKAQFDKALADAEASAKAHLAALKAERKK